MRKSRSNTQLCTAETSTTISHRGHATRPHRLIGGITGPLADGGGSVLVLRVDSRAS